MQLKFKLNSFRKIGRKPLKSLFRLNRDARNRSVVARQEESRETEVRARGPNERQGR